MTVEDGAKNLRGAVNMLNSVFWDYPQYTDPETLRNLIQKSPDKRRWVLKRFLERARVVDTWKFFSMREIADAIHELNLSPYALKKWTRMIEVYGPPGE